jgi:hypothetical protein
MFAYEALVTEVESFKMLVEQMKSGALDEDEADDKDFQV